VRKRPTAAPPAAALTRQLKTGAVIVVYCAAACVPVIILALRIARCALNLLPGQIHPEAIQAFIIGKRVPGDRIIVGSNPYESSETEYGVRNLSATLSQNELFDLAYAASLGVVYIRPDYLITGDKVEDFINVRIVMCHVGLHCCRKPPTRPYPE